MMPSTSLCFLTFLHVFLSLAPRAYGHGCMLFPNQRGGLSPRSPYVTHPISDDAKIDYFMHFPAGDKTQSPGAGEKSQRAAAGRQGWVPYNPFDKKFRWRAGVCGDMVKGKDHLKGGQFYHDGMISATFKQGSILHAEIGITAHHNGFFELYLCDVKRCKNQEISPSCFQQGHCVQLQRAGGDDCETSMSTKCAPKDPDYPGRWYLPCKQFGKPEGGRLMTYGGKSMRYKFPEHVTCEHCVLQWYWTSASTCNPPGVVEFFEGNRGPKNWNKCSGQAGAVGGYTSKQMPCGGAKFPEEYYQCSDIRIVRDGGHIRKEEHEKKNEPSPQVPPPLPQKPATPHVTSGNRDGEYKPMKGGYGAVRDIILIRNGRRIQSLLSSPVVYVDNGSDISIEAYAAEGVETVTFELFDSKRKLLMERTITSGPYFMFGTDNGIAKPWANIPFNEKVRITVSGMLNGRLDRDSITVVFKEE